MTSIHCSKLLPLSSFILLLIVGCSYSLSAEFVTDTKNNQKETKGGITGILREKINGDCQAKGIILTQEALVKYTNCFKISHNPLTFPIGDDLNDALPDARFNEMLEGWCFDWTLLSQCIRINIPNVQMCLSSQRNILMDFNLAFGDALCSKDGRDLVNVYMQFIEEGGLQCLIERNDIVDGMLTCINPLNIDHFNRNLGLVTNCIVQQLKQCPTEGPMEMLDIMIKFSTKFYMSTGDEDSKLYTDNEIDSSEEDIKKYKISSSHVDYVEIIPAAVPGRIYFFVYIAVAVGICIWLVAAVICHIIFSGKVKEVNLVRKGWQRV